MQFIIHVNTVITDKEDRILLVREKKPKTFNKLNFPGGHLEPGEELIECAKREAKEEISAEIEISGLVGIFTGQGEDHYINFIFAGEITEGAAVANTEEVNSAQWYTLNELKEINDEEILNPNKFRKIIDAFKTKPPMELNIIQELI